MIPSVHFPGLFKALRAAGIGGMRGSAAADPGVMLIRLYKLSGFPKGGICVRCIASPLIHHGLPRNPANAGLIHDSGHRLFKIIHIHNRCYAAKKELADGIAAGKSSHIPVHGFLLHGKKKDSQPILTVISQSSEGNHAKMAVGIDHTGHQDPSLTVPYLPAGALQLLLCIFEGACGADFCNFRSFYFYIAVRVYVPLHIHGDDNDIYDYGFHRFSLSFGNYSYSLMIGRC